jgi:hypothetical protein
MAITKKVNKEEIELTKQPRKEEEIQYFINSGGLSNSGEGVKKEISTVKKTRKKRKTKEQPENLQLRLYKSEVDRIDRLLEKITPRERPSRHAYILEAILDKLKKDERKM